MNTIKKIINWMNWNLGGLRDPDCFFETGDPLENAIVDNIFSEQLPPMAK